MISNYRPMVGVSSGNGLFFGASDLADFNSPFGSSFYGGYEKSFGAPNFGGLEPTLLASNLNNFESTLGAPNFGNFETYIGNSNFNSLIGNSLIGGNEQSLEASNFGINNSSLGTSFLNNFDHTQNNFNAIPGMHLNASDIGSTLLRQFGLERQIGLSNLGNNSGAFIMPELSTPNLEKFSSHPGPFGLGFDYSSLVNINGDSSNFGKLRNHGNIEISHQQSNINNLGPSQLALIGYRSNFSSDPAVYGSYFGSSSLGNFAGSVPPIDSSQLLNNMEPANQLSRAGNVGLPQTAFRGYGQNSSGFPDAYGSYVGSSYLGSFAGSIPAFGSSQLLNSIQPNDQLARAGNIHLPQAALKGYRSNISGYPDGQYFGSSSLGNVAGSVPAVDSSQLLNKMMPANQLSQAGNVGLPQTAFRGYGQNSSRFPDAYGSYLGSFAGSMPALGSSQLLNSIRPIDQLARLRNVGLPQEAFKAYRSNISGYPDGQYLGSSYLGSVAGSVPALGSSQLLYSLAKSKQPTNQFSRAGYFGVPQAAYKRYGQNFSRYPDAYGSYLGSSYLGSFAGSVPALGSSQLLNYNQDKNVDPSYQHLDKFNSTKAVLNEYGSNFRSYPGAFQPKLGYSSLGGGNSSIIGTSRLLNYNPPKKPASQLSNFGYSGSAQAAFQRYESNFISSPRVQQTSQLATSPLSNFDKIAPTPGSSRILNYNFAENELLPNQHSYLSNFAPAQHAFIGYGSSPVDAQLNRARPAIPAPRMNALGSSFGSLHLGGYDSLQNQNQTQKQPTKTGEFETIECYA